MIKERYKHNSDNFFGFLKHLGFEKLFILLFILLKLELVLQFPSKKHDLVIVNITALVFSCDVSKNAILHYHLGKFTFAGGFGHLSIIFFFVS